MNKTLTEFAKLNPCMSNNSRLIIVKHCNAVWNSSWNF